MPEIERKPKKRLFFAIELPLKLRHTIGEYALRLKRVVSDGKWVIMDNLHITMAFLGYLDDEMVEVLTENLEKATADIPEFYVETGELGAFPTLRRGRVLWLGIRKGVMETELISKRINSFVSTLNIAEADDRFHAHITLARFKTPINITSVLSSGRNIEEFPSHKFKVEHISLFESKLTPKGPHYLELTKAHLKNA